MYDPLILATCPHSSDAILALASSLKDRKIRVRSVCKSARHASELPSTARNEEMDWVANNRDAPALPRERKGFLVAGGIVLAHRCEGLVLVTDKDGGPEVVRGGFFHLRRPHKQGLEPCVFEHDADGAGQRRVAPGWHVQGQHLAALDQFIERR